MKKYFAISLCLATLSQPMVSFATFDDLPNSVGSQILDYLNAEDSKGFGLVNKSCLSISSTHDRTQSVRFGKILIELAKAQQEVSQAWRTFKTNIAEKDEDGDDIYTEQEQRRIYLETKRGNNKKHAKAYNDYKRKAAVKRELKSKLRSLIEQSNDLVLAGAMKNSKTQLIHILEELDSIADDLTNGSFEQASALFKRKTRGLVNLMGNTFRTHEDQLEVRRVSHEINKYIAKEFG